MIITYHDHIEFDYVNWRGISSHRRAEVGEIMYGSSVYHKEPQWLLEGFDLDKKEFRLFAMKDMTNVQMLKGDE